MFNSLKRKKFDDSDDDDNNIHINNNNDDDDDDDDDLFDGRKKKSRNSKKVIIKQTIYDKKKATDKKCIILDDSDVEVINDSKSNSPILNNGNNLDREAELEVQRLLQTFTSEIIDISMPDVNTTININNNENNKKTEEIDKMLNDIKMKRNKKSVPSKNHVFDIVEDDYQPLQIIIPEVRKAVERKDTSNVTVTIDLLDSLLGITTTTHSCPTANTFDPSITYIKLRTRLNGAHEHKWKIPKSDGFAKFISKFAEIYGVDKSEVIMKFDGDKLGGNQSPEDIGMDDDELIDVKISAHLYQKAVDFASNPPKAAASIPVSAFDPSITYIKLRTRLNGAHEHKWKIPKSDGFAKFISKFAEIYGVDKSEVIMKFDGDRLGGNQSPEDIGMDDDELIDVKISAHLYQKAVEFASNPLKAASIPSSNGTSSSSSSSSSSSLVIPPNEKVLLTIQCANNIINNESNSVLAITLFSSFTLDQINNSLINMKSLKPGIAVEYFSDKRPGALPTSMPLNELGIIVHNAVGNTGINKSATLEARLKAATITPMPIALPAKAPVAQVAAPVAQAAVSETIQIEIFLENLRRNDNGNTTFKVSVKLSQNFKKMVKLVRGLLDTNIKEKDLEFKFGNNILRNFNKTFRDEGIQENSRIVVTRR